MFFMYLKVVWKSDYDLQVIILLSELKNRQQTTSIIQQPTIVAWTKEEVTWEIMVNLKNRKKT